MATTIQIKRSTTTGHTPSSPAAGELSLNIPDKYIFAGNSSGGYITFKANPLAADIGDSGTTGRAILQAANAQAARTTLDVATTDAMAYSNMFVNPDHVVSQENSTNSVNVANNTLKYVSDQWVIGVSTYANVTAQVVSDAPPGFSQSFKITTPASSLTPGAADYLDVIQAIEGYRMAKTGLYTANSVPLVLGIWLKSSLTGTYCLSLRNFPTPDRSFVKGVSLTANTWTWCEVPVPAQTGGTAPSITNSGHTYFSICMAAGSNYNATDNAWSNGNLFTTSSQTNLTGTASSTFQFTGAVLLPGTKLPASSEIYRLMRPFEDELELCRRYWCSTYSYGTVPGTATTTNCLGTCEAGVSSTASNWGIYWSYPRQMRAAPSVTTYSTSSGASGKMRDDANGADVAASITLAGDRRLLLYAAPNAIGTVDLKAHLALSSRLF